MQPLPRAHRRDRRRGSAVVMALIAVTVLGGLTVALLQIGTAFNREQTSRVEDEQALFVAEAGLEEGLYALRAGHTGNVGTAGLPARYGNGVFWVERTDLGNQLVQLRSVGMVGRGRAAVTRLVFHYIAPPYTTALFSNQSFTIGSQCLVDSFDSALGSYVSQMAGSYASAGAIVQSNGDVTIDPSVEIHGDVHPGSGGEVTVPGSSDVSGTLEPAPEELLLPPVTAPAIAPSGSLLSPDDGVTTVGPGDYAFDALDVRAGTFTIEGPARVVLGDWVMRANTELVIDDSAGSVELYVGGATSLASNSEITSVSQSAASVSMFFTGGPGQVVDLASNSSYYGLIYAPEATVEIHSNFEIFGSAAADKLLVHSNVQVHFDEALGDLPWGTESWVLGTWSLDALPPGLQADRGDPYAVLGVGPGDLATPWDAHD